MTPRKKGAPTVAAIDIGATKTLVAVRTLPLAQEWHQGEGIVEFPTAREAPAEIELIATAVNRLADGRALLAAGCAAPGPLDSLSGVIERSPNLGWHNVPLATMLTGLLGAAVTLDDDAHFGALGEAVLGAGRMSRTVAYLTLSSGVGSGVVVDGALQRGDHGLAGEVGHLLVDPRGPRCSCGRRGDVESFAGGRALARRARKAWPADRARGARAPHDAAGIFAAAKAGDRIARTLVAEASVAVAVAIAAVAAVLDPGALVVGGSIAFHQPTFVGSAARLAQQRVLAETRRVLVAIPSALGNESVLAGAAVAASRLASSREATSRRKMRMGGA